MKRLLPITFLFIAAITAVLSFTTASTHPYTLNYNPKLGTPTLPFTNPLTLEGVRLGRLLFYDSLLSGNNKQSCGSCHLQQYSFTDGKPKAIGSKGDTVEKSTMTLVNMAWNNNFFWDGRARSLEDVIPQPISNKKEMDQDTAELIKELNRHAYYPKLFESAFPGQKITMATVSKALAQFVRTIYSDGVNLPDSIFNKNDYAAQDTAKMQAIYRNEVSLRGSFYRFAFMCSPCHGGLNYGGIKMADNMVEPGNHFKAPTLLNIALTAPYMHDGRFKTIEQVLDHYNQHITELYARNPQVLQKPIENMIKDCDKKNFPRVLELFTDSAVLTNKALSNPFDEKDFKWN